MGLRRGLCINHAFWTWKFFTGKELSFCLNTQKHSISYTVPQAGLVISVFGPGHGVLTLKEGEFDSTTKENGCLAVEVNNRLEQSQGRARGKHKPAT